MNKEAQNELANGVIGLAKESWRKVFEILSNQIPDTLSLINELTPLQYFVTDLMIFRCNIDTEIKEKLRDLYLADMKKAFDTDTYTFENIMETRVPKYVEALKKSSESEYKMNLARVFADFIHKQYDLKLIMELTVRIHAYSMALVEFITSSISKIDSMDIK